MDATLHLPGITEHTIKTDRLTVAYLTAGTGDVPIVLVHGNCASSLFFQDFMLALAATGRYTVYAPDMRGYGESDALPVDATRCLKDFSDDVDAFFVGLNLL
jgi:pimeloyl-ACP methyl ester carboxylesterase